MIPYSREPNVPRASRIPSADALPSGGQGDQQGVGDKLESGCLTIHDHPHILDETVDNLEGLCCSRTSLILGQSI
jgi:hypothetical protein